MIVWMQKRFSKFFMVCLFICMLINVEVFATEQQVTAKINTSVSDHAYAGDIIDIDLEIHGEPVKDVVMPSDVVLVMDCSGSMSSENRFTAMQSAAKEFVKMVDFSYHRIGIVAYDSDTSICSITDDTAILDSFIDSLSYNGTTRTDLGIEKAVSLLNTGRSNATKVIILLTDGGADSIDLMKQEGEKAKDKGIVIFTVALLSSSDNPDTSVPNQQLKEVATSGGHHHFVLGSQGLIPVYQEIAQQIGVANVYDVRIQQTISEQFELVSGSTDNNIPQPKISGNILTWKLEELREETLHLTYQIRVKSGVKSGDYLHTSYGNVSYNDYKGVHKSLTLTPVSITIVNYPPVIDSITPSSFGLEGGDKVIITGQNFQTGAKVKVDGVTISKAVILNSNTIEFTIPSHKQATVSVSVVNPTGESDSVSVCFMADPVVTKISPSYCAYEGGKIVKFTCKYIMDGATVTFDGIKANVTLYETEYIKVKVPFIDKSGVVDVVVTNPDGTSFVFSNGFTYEAKPVPPAPTIAKVSPNTSDANKIKVVKITGTNFQGGGNFNVTVGGVEATVTTIESTYIKCKVPAMAVGTYDIIVTNADGQQIILKDAYTYVGEAPNPAPVITKLSPSSGNVGVTKLIKINGANFVEGDNFKILIGDVLATVTLIETTYVKCKVPATLPVGTYDLTINKW